MTDRERAWEEYKSIPAGDEVFEGPGRIGEGLERQFLHRPRPPIIGVDEMQRDAIRSIMAGEPAEEWEARWKETLDEQAFRQEREGTWSPQEP